jgi:hypothetical protein
MAIVAWDQGDDWIITVLVDKNPKRIVTFAHKRFELYRPKMTVAEPLRSRKL